MTFVLTLAAAAAAVGIEMLEALAIVLAVGMTRGLRDALLGALAAVAAVVLLCLAVGPALVAGADLHILRVIVGSLLLLFGLEWLRKGILRMAGHRRPSSSYDEFVEERVLPLRALAQLLELLLGHPLGVEAHVRDPGLEVSDAAVVEPHLAPDERGEVRAVGLARDRHDHLPGDVPAEDEDAGAVELAGVHELLEAYVGAVQVGREEDPQLVVRSALAEHR